MILQFVCLIKLVLILSTYFVSNIGCSPTPPVFRVHDQIKNGQRFTSSNGRFELINQEVDGNLIIYFLPVKVAVWQSQQHKKPVLKVPNYLRYKNNIISS